MHLLSRPLTLVGAFLLGVFAVGCSHEHGPLSETPDTTSLANAGRWGVRYVSTSEGVTWRPEDPNAVIPNTVQGELSPLTTEVQPLLTLLGTREDWSYGQTFAPQTGWALNSWTSGPVLPVEPWNMAMEAPEGGEGPGGGHGAKAHGSGH